MQREGHAVCNHTATHKDMTGLSKAAFTKELTRLAEAYTALTGDTIAPFYRPPEGRFNESNLLWAKELGYKTVFWSFAYADWDNQKQPDATRALEKLTGHLHNGEVLLLHPTSSTTAEILGKFIEYAKSEGYRFDSLHALTAKAQNLPTVFPAPAHHGCLPLEYETA